ncbi:uracil-DNA glycosylase [Candidatus Nitrosotenuis aquarius]|uniref:uracil-DNA glycosylase n=1 Tax=Candidatus Nitrosotenuis aquarius TaxID=1846278 RepID=UPI000C1E8983|nr:uracil-DNA glycosylase [Candidatus Nitrosotenuis aquarius]
MSISEIRDHVISCTKCELCKTRTNAVPGKGNPSAKIVFIGEAPGRTEDIRGEPFVGSAGKKLSDALAKNGILRDSVYITNVVKCRPPNNRVPNESERESCRPYLNAELEAIKPEIICVLGNTASNSVLGQGEITKNRGKIIEKDGKKYFLTFHPAAIIYNQELAAIFESDIATLAKLVK